MDSLNALSGLMQGESVSPYKSTDDRKIIILSKDTIGEKTMVSTCSRDIILYVLHCPQSSFYFDI